MYRWFYMLITLCGWVFCPACNVKENTSLQFIPPDNPAMQYMGRIDFSNPKLPRFWQPGVTINFRFKGDSCKLLVNDEVLWGKSHNYYQLVADGASYRLQTKSAADTIDVTPYLSSQEEHTVSLVKNTEAGIGYMEWAGVLLNGPLLQLPAMPERKIEFIGNSITSAMGNDASEIPCKTAEWYDQHNAYRGYGAITARALNAQYHLSSVSGIGLMHSCCDMDIIMPEVYDKVDMRDNKVQWDFAMYQPDVISICLGQNDGVQDETAFVDNYVTFLKQVKEKNPSAKIILLSSPMADDKLRDFQRKVLPLVAGKVKSENNDEVIYHVFGKQYVAGCDWHPDIKEHELIAAELIPVIQKAMNWQ